MAAVAGVMRKLKPQRPLWKTVGRELNRNKYLYLLFLPTLAYFIIFCYVPMYGLFVAFKANNVNMALNLFKGEWVGLSNFMKFFDSYYFGRLIRNTVTLSLATILCNTPIPIAFAILLNEVRRGFGKRFIQTVSYFPHFISLVIVMSLIRNFLHPVDGVVNLLITALGGQAVNFLAQPAWYYPIYLISGVWQDFGWSSILYLAALSSISPELYEAAGIEGANKLQKIRYITFPHLVPTIIILFILDMGGVMNVGFEKVYLLYSPGLYNVADVISTFTYRYGIQGSDFSYATAVGLFNSVVNFAVLLLVNSLSRRITKTSLW